VLDGTLRAGDDGLGESGGSARVGVLVHLVRVRARIRRIGNLDGGTASGRERAIRAHSDGSNLDEVLLLGALELGLGGSVLLGRAGEFSRLGYVLSGRRGVLLLGVDLAGQENGTGTSNSVLKEGGHLFLLRASGKRYKRE